MGAGKSARKHKLVTNVIREGKTVQLAIWVLVVVLALLIFDLAADMAEEVGLLHLLSEGLAALVAIVGVGLLVDRIRRLHRQQRRLAQRLELSESEAQMWREETADLRRGLRSAMDRQFDRWELTPAEREIAMYLLRGLSHKQIAGRRKASERTVRQQAHMLYRKAGMAGRSDLSAFFLSDLFAEESSQSMQV